MKSYSGLVSASVIAVICHRFMCTSGKPWNKTKLMSVTRFPGMEDLYREIRLMNESNRILLKLNQATDAAIKSRLCYYIFQSNHFKMLKEEPLDPQIRQVHHELYTNYPHIYSALYKENKRNWHSCFPCASRHARIYDNDYKKLPITIAQDTTNEYLFTCLTRNKETEKINQYFVSIEYNVNTSNAAYWMKDYITGRFIFSHNSENEIVLHALAEESAIVHKGLVDHELLYLARRERFQAAETPKKDPVCKLNQAEKLRICSSILSSSRYRSTVKFYPRMENVLDTCVKRSVYFEKDKIRQMASKRRQVYEEWTIGCRTTPEGSSNEVGVTYYVSRSYHFNKAFVYSLVAEGSGQNWTRNLIEQYMIEYKG